MLKKGWVKLRQWWCGGILKRHTGKYWSSEDEIVKKEMIRGVATYQYKERLIPLNTFKPRLFKDFDTLVKTTHDVMHITIKCACCGKVYTTTRYNRIGNKTEIKLTTPPPNRNVTADKLICHKHGEPLVKFDCFFPYHNEYSQCELCIALEEQEKVECQK